MYLLNEVFKPLQIIVDSVLRTVDSEVHETANENKSPGGRQNGHLTVTGRRIIIPKHLVLSQDIIDRQHPNDECFLVLFTQVGQIIQAEAKAVKVDRFSLVADNVFALCLVICQVEIRSAAGKTVTGIKARFPRKDKFFHDQRSGMFCRKIGLHGNRVIQKIPFGIQQ